MLYSERMTPPCAAIADESAVALCLLKEELTREEMRHQTCEAKAQCQPLAGKEADDPARPRWRSLLIAAAAGGSAVGRGRNRRVRRASHVFLCFLHHSSRKLIPIYLKQADLEAPSIMVQVGESGLGKGDDGGTKISPSSHRRFLRGAETPGSWACMGWH